ncbi:response regulator [Candidatus Laterigemmans baculatus]|uniref:response regulator n=1 Tax=Candidatus Laterigemmans baculatus TaxID=2770505 RepID=UPI001F16E1EB
MIQSHFDAVVEQTHDGAETLARLRKGGVDLVLVNRKLDRDYSDGLDVIRQIKSDDQLSDVPVMLVTNYEEHQQAAVAVGAVAGFGKLALSDPQTHALLEPILG